MRSASIVVKSVEYKPEVVSDAAAASSPAAGARCSLRQRGGFEARVARPELKYCERTCHNSEVHSRVADVARAGAGRCPRVRSRSRRGPTAGAAALRALKNDYCTSEGANDLTCFARLEARGAGGRARGRGAPPALIRLFEGISPPNVFIPFISDAGGGQRRRRRDGVRSQTIYPAILVRPTAVAPSHRHSFSGKHFLNLPTLCSLVPASPVRVVTFAPVSVTSKRATSCERNVPESYREMA
ncbi:hypothetical protein EVAR_9977_1 [Eumeta japonica]|uniref:Uncharacterized protein n=1 Tax=Eumeta variegata TaxID=151549 RepID=A0A4C1TQY1_EUMVA|nr:hypothetical protein EVAR_9977_1 [Eumeta japonica]